MHPLIRVQRALNKALLRAVEDNLPETVQEYLSLGAQVNNDTYPLHHAVERGHTECARILIAAGANVDAKNVNAEYDRDKTPLHYAAKEGNTECVVLLIAAGADVDAKDDFQNTALHHAAMSGSYKPLIRALVKAGANVDARNCMKKTPLHHAAELETAKILIELGADVNAENSYGATPLHYSTCSFITNLYIKHGADPNKPDDKGKTLLHYLAIRDSKGSLNKINRDCIHYLLNDHNVNVDAQDKDGKTALHYAVDRRDSELAGDFTQYHGADASLADKDGNTPLHDAVRIGDRYLINAVLLSRKIGREKNNRGETPASLIETLHAIRAQCLHSQLPSHLQPQ